MKSIIKEENKELDFPRLMRNINDDYIVLFLNKSEGIIISNSSTASINYIGNSLIVGDCTDSWEINNFTDFNGEVILSN